MKYNFQATRRLIAKPTVNPAAILKIRRGTFAEEMPEDAAALELKAER